MPRRRAKKRGGARKAAAHAPGPIASLPTSILERVLLLALPVDVERVVPEPIEALPLREMQSLALVARDWHVCMARLHDRLVRRDVDVVVARRGFCVLHADWQRSVNPTKMDLDVEILRLTIKEINDRQTWTCDWHAMFKLFPNLRRLDLSKVSVRSRHLPALLAAASTQCGRLEALILTHVDWGIAQAGRPDMYRFLWGHGREEEEEEDEDSDFDEFEFIDDDDDDDDDRVINFGGGNPPGKVRGETGHELDPTFDALYAALERWYTTGVNSGLRQLVVVERRSVDRVEDNNAFMGAVARYCPRIAFLDGSSNSTRCCALFFPALPALEELSFDCAAHESDAFFALGELLTDDLVATIVSSCPQLRKLDWRIRCQGRHSHIDTALTHFSDVALVSLSTLPFFEELDIPLSSTACTEAGLLAFARANRSTRARRRNLNYFHVDLTGERGSVLAFINQVLAEDTDIFAGPSLSMSLRTSLYISKEDTEQLTARLTRRNVHAFFNRTFAYGDAMPVSMVVLSTLRPAHDAPSDD